MSKDCCTLIRSNPMCTYLPRLPTVRRYLGPVPPFRRCTVWAAGDFTQWMMIPVRLSLTFLAANLDLAVYEPEAFIRACLTTGRLVYLQHGREPVSWESAGSRLQSAGFYVKRTYVPCYSFCLVLRQLGIACTFARSLLRLKFNLPRQTSICSTSSCVSKSNSVTVSPT